MQIVSSSSDGCIILEPLLREGGPMPAVYVSARVQKNRFKGYHPRVALELSELVRFTMELGRLAESRSGIATLHSMSPNVLTLTFEYLRIRPSSNITGPVLLQVALRQDTTLEDSGLSSNNSLALSFEIAPQSLAEIIEDLESLTG